MWRDPHAEHDRNHPHGRQADGVAASNFAANHDGLVLWFAPMSIWRKIASAASRLTTGGPLGALGRAISGRLAGGRAAPECQVVFTIGVIALSAKMAKADGVVTCDEVAAFRQIFAVPPEEMRNVTRVFNYAKRDTAGFEAYARQLAGLLGNRPGILEDVLDGLFRIATADGVLHPREIAYLEEVGRLFDISDARFARIRARHAPPDEGDPYVVLGVDRDRRLDEIKRIYRRLVAESHPDRLIARGVPEEFIEIANHRVAALNAAWERIRAEHTA